MAHKHELMAKLQAARQTSAKVVEAENQKAYPENSEIKQQEIPLIPGEEDASDPTTSAKTEAPRQEEAPTGENPGETAPETEAEEAPKKVIEKIAYTTISVPKPYGQKAKLYATLLQVNMVEFTCGALDAYVLQLQEMGKLPRVDV